MNDLACRSLPPCSPGTCKGLRKKGNDGLFYMSRPSYKRNGTWVYKWERVTHMHKGVPPENKFNLFDQI